MRIAHLADCHLGYRAGQRMTANGVNIREQDVAEAFRACVDGILSARPDMVCIAGDLFHGAKPGNVAITFAFRQLRRLRDAGLPIVLVAGNHDQTRVGGIGSILHLFTELGIEVATNAVRHLIYPDLNLAVTAVPDRASLEGITPGDATYRVLVIHGAVEGTYPNVPGVIPKAFAESEAWTYQAWGDFHHCHQIGPRAWYSGSTEYTSTNIWSELEIPKSWLLVNLKSGAVEPQLIPQCRAIHDLGPLDARDLTAEQLQQQMTAMIDGIPGGLAGAVVRLKVTDVPRQISRLLDHVTIRRWKATALNLNLDLRKPETREVGGGIARFVGGRRKTLPELVGDYLAQRVLPEGLDRSAFLQLGAEALREREEPVEEKVCI